jgi:YidC/Oxa1 family membrane protein insertase
MKRIQPKIDELKERYKNDRAKLQKAQAELLQKEGAMPPLSGCLPIFLQIPVFFGLFAALRSNFDLRQAPFHLWIHDLSEPDRMFRIDVTLPLIGTVPYFNLLPPLMVGLWILQQRFMPKPSDPQQARMQSMMMWMPVLMGFFLYNYAAGLSLYMITQSTLGIFELGVIKRFWPVDATEHAKKTGWFARFAEMQRRQMEEMQKARGRSPSAREKRKKKRR